MPKVVRLPVRQAALAKREHSVILSPRIPVYLVRSLPSRINSQRPSQAPRALVRLALRPRIRQRQRQLQLVFLAEAEPLVSHSNNHNSKPKVSVLSEHLRSLNSRQEVFSVGVPLDRPHLSRHFQRLVEEQVSYPG